MQNIFTFLKKYRSYIFLFLIVVLAFKVFVPQLDELKEGLEALRSADKEWFMLGVIVYWIGLPVLALQFMSIAKKVILFWLTLKVQIAGLFVSKLLPSSLGTLTLNTYYLTQRKHTIHQAASVMAMNGITSGIAYFTLIILALAATTASAEGPFSDKRLILWVVAGMGIVLLLLYLLARTRVVRKIMQEKFGSVVESIAEYKSNRRGVLRAILLNGIGSVTSNFALYASAQAVGMDITLPQAFLAYTFGNVAAALVPTPGGLGATEAGLYGAFVLMGFDTSSSMAAVLLYRLISFWIPTIPGYVAFWSLRKDVLVNFSFKANKAA